MEMIISIISVVLAIVSIVASYIFFRKSTKRKKLSIFAFSSEIISKDLAKNEKLQFSYNEQEISSLTSSTIQIVNEGNDTIESGDFYKGKPLTITTSTPLLSRDDDCLKIETSNSKTKITTDYINDNTIQIEIEALRPKDFVAITLLHSGTIHIDADLKSGTVDNMLGGRSMLSVVKTSDTVEKYEQKNDAASVVDYMYKVLVPIVFVTILLSFLLLKVLSVIDPVYMEHSNIFYMFIPMIFLAFIELVWLIRKK